MAENHPLKEALQRVLLGAIQALLENEVHQELCVSAGSRGQIRLCGGFPAALRGADDEQGARV
jgi:hypothetical protein